MALPRHFNYVPHLELVTSLPNKVERQYFASAYAEPKHFPQEHQKEINFVNEIHKLTIRIYFWNLK
ncbi:hypothetical protein HYS31_05875 [Candidatus Woesearchaeota archaeon]|nr:hypothetical protein [Candidatus Woesearchaeota archaeon]